MIKRRANYNQCKTNEADNKDLDRVDGTASSEILEKSKTGYLKRSI